MSEERADDIRTSIRGELANQQTEGSQRIAHALKRKTLLGGERQKLLQAHYAGAIPADLLATEMRRFTRELAEAEVEIQAAGVNTVELAAVLEAALRAVTNCEVAYLTAPNPIRRQINQGFFKKLYVNEDGNVARVELTEPFATLLPGGGAVLVEPDAPPVVDDVVAVQPPRHIVLASQIAVRPLALVAAGGTAAEHDLGFRPFWTAESGVTDREYDATPGDFNRPDVGVNKTYMVGDVEALSHHSTPVQRLLDLAKTWPDTPNGAGPTPPPKPFKTLPKLKPSEIDELVERYQAGSSVYQLAKHYGIHRITIGKHLRSRGINTTVPALVEEQVKEAAQLYMDGWSCKKIAKHFGVGAETVRERLHEEGVPLRGPHERMQKR